MALIIVWVVLPALWAGCKSSVPTQAHSETKVVRLWHTFNASEAATVAELIKTFEADHPGVRVEVTVLPFGSARNRLRAALAQGDGPDVARAEVAWLPELARDGLLVDVSQHVELQTHLPQIRRFVHWDGRTWAFPQGVDCLVLYYNAQHLRQAKLSPPKTWPELASAARGLTVADERHGLSLKADGYHFLPALWAFGGGTVSVDASQILIDTPNSIEAATFYRALALDPTATTPSLDLANEYNDELDRFGRAQVSMIINGPWAARELLGRPAFAQASNLGIAPVPRGPKGQGGSPAGGHVYTLSARTQHAQLALALAKHLSGLDAQRQMALQNHLLPTLESAYTQPEIRQDRILMAFRQALEQSHDRAIFPGMARLFDALNPAMHRLLRQESTPETLMQSVGAQWRQLRPDE